MISAFILLILRVLSALLLLAFLGGIAWLIYQDMRLLTLPAPESAKPVEAILRVVVSGSGVPLAGTVFPLKSETSIGRAASNTVVLDDQYASGDHVRILRRGSQWVLEDLGSRNGTLLNDLPLTETAVVGVGDVITIGDTWFKIELVDEV